MHRLCLWLAGLIMFAPALLPAQEQPQFSTKLKPGQHVLIIRHALAPGTGDPTDFVLNDCSTQRNLSPAGIQQAEKIGLMLNATGHDFQAYSSQWCRCRDTALHLGLDDFAEQPLLNSFFREGDPGNQQTNKLKHWIIRSHWQQIPVLVTHQVNITALLGIYPRSGEVLVLEPSDNGFNLIERIRTD